MSPQSQSTMTAQHATGKTSVRPLRILVADDDHLIASGLVSSLKSLGHDVLGPAANGQSAIESARTQRPDLAVLDIRMPIMTGLEAAAILWGEMAVPTVIVSAYSDEDYLSQASDVGVFGYLLKPITAESLRVSITVAWGRAGKEGDHLNRISQLEQNLRNRQVVEQAKWKLVERFGVSEPEAHARMQRAARNTRQPLVQIAKQIIDSDDLGAGGMGTSARRDEQAG